MKKNEDILLNYFFQKKLSIIFGVKIVSFHPCSKNERRSLFLNFDRYFFERERELTAKHF